MADSSQKTEKPTQQRLKKARADGKFPVSKEFVAGLQFLVFLAIVSSYGGAWIVRVQQVMREALGRAFSDSLTPQQFVDLIEQVLRDAIVPVGIAGAVLVGTGLAFHLGSTRASVALEKLQPSFDHFNPVNKLKNIPQQSIPAVLQALLVLAVLGALLFSLIESNATTFLQLPFTSLTAGLQQSRGVIMEVLWKAAAVFLLIGVIDLFRQTRRYMKQMRMSKQEIKEELKETDGNPHTKMRIRRLQRDLRRRKMMSEVATATAVIVNPTHYAVAIKYQHDSQSAPMVVAKGKNFLALRIRERAVLNQVPLIENPPLARALYQSVEVGQEIPPHLYRAVAEILAYIYRLMGVSAK